MSQDDYTTFVHGKEKEFSTEKKLRASLVEYGYGYLYYYPRLPVGYT